MDTQPNIVCWGKVAEVLYLTCSISLNAAELRVFWSVLQLFSRRWKLQANHPACQQSLAVA
jgi:hypothetical protein